MRYALVSRQLLDGAGRVGLIYRDRPFGAQDSGWRVFAGDEDGEFAADPRNTVMIPLQQVAERFPETAGCFDEAPGTAFEADGQGKLVRAKAENE